MAKRIVYPTDPDYLEVFYRLWGSGQSTTVRQKQKKSKKSSDTPVASGKGAHDTRERPSGKSR